MLLLVLLLLVVEFEMQVILVWIRFVVGYRFQDSDLVEASDRSSPMGGSPSSIWPTRSSQNSLLLFFTARVASKLARNLARMSILQPDSINVRATAAAGLVVRSIMR